MLINKKRKKTTEMRNVKLIVQLMRDQNIN